MVKRLIFVFVVLCLLTPLACAGGGQSQVPKLQTIRLVGTIGPLSIPLAYMQENNSLGKVAEKTELSIWANPTQLQAIISSGQADFVALPTTSAAIFYNRGVILKLLDSSIWNILYLVTSDTSVRSINDLKGKRVVVPYQGAIPDAMFRYACKVQGIDPESDIEIFYAPDPVQASQLLLLGQDNYVLLSEPSATGVILKGQSQGKTFVRALNMQDEWKKAGSGETSTPVAGNIVLGAMAENKAVVDTFISEYDKAVQWMLAHPEEAGEIGAKVLAEQGFTDKVLTESMKNINWHFVSAADARQDLEAFFKAISEISPSFIGGKQPDAEFIYAKN